MVFGALMGGTTAIALVGLFYAGQQIAGLPFIPFDIFDWLARTLPGGLLTFVIDAMVGIIHGLNLGQISEVAKLVEQAMAVLMVAGTGILMGASIARLLPRVSWTGGQLGLAGGMILLLPALFVELASGTSHPVPLVWFSALLLGWGYLLGGWIESYVVAYAAGEEERSLSGRREAIAKIVGGSLAIAFGGWGLGRLVTGMTVPAEEAGRAATQPRPGTTVPQARLSSVPPRQLQPAPGTRAEITPNADFYRIDINLLPVRVDGENWRLDLAGLFDRPGLLTLTDILAYPAVTQPLTLSCISNPIGGDLISASQWTGVRLVDFLEDRGIRSEARALQVVATDGFFESVSMADMTDPRTLLVYAMNGEVLPQAHGYPLRIYIPNRYGMKQPKWITRIKAIDHDGEGYWVVRGWSKEARPHIISIMDPVSTGQGVDGRIPVGGIAWAGDRGIQRVEVQVDDGAWEEARILDPPMSPLIWVLWRYDWPASSGRHLLRVRAFDGTGAAQIAERSGPHPNGATGYHERAVTV